MPNQVLEYSLPDLLEQFPNDQACTQYLFEKKYAKIRCPKCKRTDHYYLNKINLCYTCTCGKHQFYPRTGTLFFNSRIQLQPWFIVIFLYTKAIITTSELMRMMGITAPTAMKIQNNIFTIMSKNVKDKEHLTSWNNKVNQTFTKVNDENIELYQCFFQFRHEMRKGKKDPFFVLLDLAMNI